MKHRLLFFFILLTCAKAHSQVKYIIEDSIKVRCRYKYTLQEVPDDQTSVKVVDMLLLVGNDLARFSSLASAITDSIVFDSQALSIEADFLKVWGEVSGLTTSSLSGYKIYSSLNNELIVQNELLIPSMGSYFSEEISQLDWTLEKKDTLIGVLNCKSATTFYAGRNYRAWYSMEYPISVGPYKFHGLPGLVVSVADDKKEHFFELQELISGNDLGLILRSDNKKTECSREKIVDLLAQKRQQLVKKMSNNTFTGGEEQKMEVSNRVALRSNFIEIYE